MKKLLTILLMAVTLSSIGQTTIAGSYTEGNVVVVNKSNLRVLFEDYEVVDGDIVLDTAAAEGDEYIAIPTAA